MGSSDLLFMMISAVLVLLMTPGLALFYGGLTGKRSAVTIMMQTMFALGLVAVIWMLFGFSLAFAPASGFSSLFYGSSYYFFLGNMNPLTSGGDETLVFMLYQMMVAVITPVLIVGAFPGRFRFGAFSIFLVLWMFLVYIPIAHMIWGNGLFQRWGVLDFSGGIVVHSAAGFSALAAALYLGRARMKNDAPHNIPMVVLGMGLLWFGWFGFNSGSAMGVTPIAVLSFINTAISASFASLTWTVLDRIHRGKISSVGFMTGALAGLVIITPAAGYVTIQSAMVIGIIGAIVAYLAILFKNRMDWSDALDVWGVHGMDGFAGILMLGILGSIGTTGLILGNGVFFVKEFVAVASLAAYSFGLTYVILVLINKFVNIKVDEREEAEGQDMVELGEEAYA